MSVSIGSVPFRIGRSSDAHFRITAPTVSAAHAEITLGDAGWTVRDCGSRNGTSVNGARLTSGLEVPLGSGDVITIGDHVFTFRAIESGLVPRARDITSPGFAAAKPALRPSSFPRPSPVEREVAPVLEAASSSLFGVAGYSKRGLWDERVERLASSARRRAALADASGPLRVMAPTTIAELTRLDADGVLTTLGALVAGVPAIVPVAVLELGALTEGETLTRLRTTLRSIGAELCFARIGSGETNLAALADHPPDYLWLDDVLVRELESSTARRKLVGALVEVLVTHGGRVIAPVLDAPATLAACVELGCALVTSEPAEPVSDTG